MARRLLVRHVDMALRARRFRSRRAFTLIELMIVVAIVGILAVIGVVGYRKLVNNSKMTEATGVVNGIKVAEEAYKTERGVYADIGATPCPSDGTNAYKQKVQWDPTCNGGTQTWAVLPMHVDAPVAFGYTVRSAGAPDGKGVAVVTGLDTTQPWYIIYAVADLDQGATGVSEVLTTSQGTQVWTKGDGI